MSLSLSQQWSRLRGVAPGSSGVPGPQARADGSRHADDHGVCLVACHLDGAERVSRLWTLVQTEAGLPPPAISVDGASGWRLWFALAQPCPQAEVEGVLGRLLSGLMNQAGAEPPAAKDAAAALVFSCWPVAPTSALEAGGHADTGAEADWPPVPRQVATDRWSAFVAPDLVPVFAESPWLDCAPGEEGQAALLARLAPIEAADWARLVNAAAAPGPRGQAEGAEIAQGGGTQPGVQASLAARAFLVSVMNDERAELALRIEAARVLLAHG